MKPIQILEVENTLFHIGKNKNGYWGINHKYVEEKGIKQAVNGLEGNLSESYLQTVRLCWLSVKRASIQHLYDENNMEAWFDTFERLDEFDKLCITEAWMQTRFIHLN